MRRRQFITLVGGAAAWPLQARAQQPGLPVIGFVSVSSVIDARFDAAFRKGLNGSGIIDGQNATIEYHFLNGQYDRLPALMTDLVHRRVAVIATSASAPTALAAKAATSTIPIVFTVADDPVKLGLVANLARPGGNATGSNLFLAEITAKRLNLLHDLVPKAVRIAVLLNPANATNTETALRDVTEAAGALGLLLQVLKASTIPEIDQAFADMARERADALFIGPDSFFTARRAQFATLAARYGIPTSHPNRDSVEAGGLMSYGTDPAEAYRQVGDYVGRILKGASPAILPVVQSTKFELAINLTTARALGVPVPPDMLTIADEVIE
jgi:putative ABC transport system substrate-binding protein